jgi:hypothetical protein
MLDPSSADGSVQNSRQLGGRVFAVPNLGQEFIVAWQRSQMSIDLAFKVPTKRPPILQANCVIQRKTSFCKTIARNQNVNVLE